MFFLLGLSCFFWEPFSQSERKFGSLLRSEETGLNFLVLPLLLLPPVRDKDGLWVVEISFEAPAVHHTAPLVCYSIEREKTANKCAWDLPSFSWLTFKFLDLTKTLY